MGNYQNKIMIRRLTIIAAIVFAFAQVITAQQLKPTEIVYSRLPADLSQPPVGANSPTIWAVGQDGSNDRKITDGMAPRISDDGRFLLFRRLTCTTLNFPYCYNPYAGQPTGRLFVRDLRNNTETMVLNFEGQSRRLIGYYFSPESNRGDYQIILDYGSLVYEMNIDGTNLTPLEYYFGTGFPRERDYFPVLRRGDSRIALRSGTDNGLVTRTLGAEVPVNVPNTVLGDDNPSWSNDNQYLGFTTIGESRNGNIETPWYPYFFRSLSKIKPDGTGKTLLLDTGGTFQNSNGIAYGTIWTEDNSKIIIAARINGVAGLYAVKTDGSGYTQIPVSAGTAPDWVGGIVQPRVEQNVTSFGGGVATNGNYSLVSTIGETIAGQTSSGGSYNLESGFWAMFKAMRRSFFDFDGDSKTDIGIFRPSTGVWWINSSSSGGTNALQFGTSSDKIVPGDYTGDGKTDIAFFQQSSGNWFILRSEDNSFYAFPFGSSTDIAAPGDFDGDGKTDPAVYRPSNAVWYIIRSSDGGVTAQAFGTSEDKPVVADYDGDGKDDIAIYRPSTNVWWIQKSATNTAFAVQFGQAGDKTIPGDYTGDGKADIGFFRPSNGNWYILRSEDNSFYAFPFGSGEDVVAPGDYDGDGKFDPAVFRPSNATWYLLRSNSGFSAVAFGASGDQPVSNAFVR